MTNFYNEGREEMLRTLGISKTATPLIAKAPLLARAGGWLKQKLPQWGQGAKEMAIGSPGKFVDELSRGKAFGKGSLVRQSFHAPGLLNKVFWYGLPAYEGAKIMRSDDPDKAARMGGLIGGTALGIGAFRPLGLAGSMGLGMLGERVGSGVGRTVRHMSQGQGISPEGRWTSPSPQNQYPQMQGALPQYPAFQNRSWVNR